ncbi:ABC transporter ATP-binding protein [Subdoligranulum variabile]|uniref:ABC transporter ATP-binding protein n=1 Tax=Subdoligranulum variabile TaxID=214851 RepID=UPI002941BFE8|nr:ABC transporter ATP-binding protein [Subdoligranulum variabile]
MIEFKNVSQGYKGKTVLTGISMTIQTGEFIVLIGSSGCGKTTLLKTINKLNPLEKGDIRIDGVSIKNIPDNKLRRGIGYVIQDGGLFPHMTVGENISLLLKISGLDAKQVPTRIDELLGMVNLDPDTFRDSFPIQLSGGQKQRVGVARAFAADPEIILMDEPFSALDPVTRGELQNEAVKLQKHFGKTIVFVTHDMDEAIKMADRICIIQDGKIAQFDKPEEILKHPANTYVEEFVGKNRLWGNPAYIKAADIMKKGAIRISKNRTVLQALQIMKHHVVDSLLVTSGKNLKLEGIVWLENLQEFQNYSSSLEDFISTDYTFVYEDTSLQEIIDTIDYNISGIIPVINQKRELQGYLTKSSLLLALSKRYRKDDEELLEE